MHADLYVPQTGLFTSHPVKKRDVILSSVHLHLACMPNLSVVLANYKNATAMLQSESDEYV